MEFWIQKSHFIWSSLPLILSIWNLKFNFRIQLSIASLQLCLWSDKNLQGLSLGLNNFTFFIPSSSSSSLHIPPTTTPLQLLIQLFLQVEA